MTDRTAEIFNNNNGFKTMFEHATIGILVVSSRGFIEMANPFAEKLFGYELNSLRGQKLEVLIPEDFKKTHAGHHSGYFNKPRERKMGAGNSLFARKKDGALLAVEISLGHFDINGEVFAVTYITDISDRKASDEALRKSEKRYRFLFDNSKDLRAFYKVIRDSNGDVIDMIIEEVNPSFKELVLQYTTIANDFVGHSIKEIDDNYAQNLLECNIAMKTGKNRNYLRYNLKRDWCLLATIIPIDDEHCFAYGVDISTQKRIESELNKLNKELETRVDERTEALASAMNELAQSKDELVKALLKEKELNELKSRFITTASHEFRTPLATILSSVSLIEKYSEKEEQEKRKKHIERIQSSVNNLTEILNDFLSLGKLEEGGISVKPEPLLIDEFLKEVLDENKSILKKDQKINYKHIDGNPGVNIDKQIFKNVILNLFSNAVKYSAEGKNIDITTEIGNDVLKLNVKDYGIGIPENDQKHLFSRFFRAKNAVNIEGTGLGLNIVKKYVELLRGHISFKSKLEEGSEFLVEIPIK